MKNATSRIQELVTFSWSKRERRLATVETRAPLISCSITWTYSRSLSHSLSFYFLFLMKSHLQSYPCPLQINSFWNLGFLLAATIILQIITGIFLGLHYTSDLNSAYSSIFFFIREIYYGWSLRYLHSSGASFVFLFQFLHLGRAISYGSYFYNPNTFFSNFISINLGKVSIEWRNQKWRYLPKNWEHAPLS